MVARIYPVELELNTTNSSDTEATFIDLNLCISNGIYVYLMVEFPSQFMINGSILILIWPISLFWMAMSPPNSPLPAPPPRPPGVSHRVYISQLIRFARASSDLSDFNCHNNALTAKLLRQGYRYFKLRKAFSKFYCRHSALVEKI